MTSGETQMPIPIIHQTDLFRPHNDPDDHWDLACVYALARAGDVDLKSIIIDYPPPHHRGDPDVLAVAQMNYLTGLHVPLGIGSASATMGSDDNRERSLREDASGAGMILNTLKNSPAPVMITIAGSCRDVASAASRAPQLFREKCGGIYLNAGTGSRHVEAVAELEYNVRLDPLAFSAIFAIPCPIYWIPCFEVITSQLQVSEFGSWYDFLQADILMQLSDGVQKYFAYALGKTQDSNWLEYIHKERDQELLARQGQIRRNVWCTGGFFHAAGKSITSEGKILPRDQAGDEPVFAFDPITVQCDADGITKWSPAAEPTTQFIFRVSDVENYGKAMTAAMKALLRTLP